MVIYACIIDDTVQWLHLYCSLHLCNKLTIIYISDMICINLFSGVHQQRMTKRTFLNKSVCHIWHVCCGLLLKMEFCGVVLFIQPPMFQKDAIRWSLF